MHALRSPCRRPVSQHHGQAGASLIEFSVAVIPVLLLGLGSIELAQWFYIKQAVSLALAEAGRAGIVAHASPASIEAAFEQALLPLFPPTTTQTSSQRLKQTLARRSTALAAPAWQIEILAPTALAFQDFQDRHLSISQQTGLPAINNNYQTEQDQRNHQRGWPGGLGPSSGQSIYEANTLVLRATYPQEPMLPGMKGLIRLLPGGGRSYGQHAMATAGYLPIQQEIRLVMQSHPLQWPDAASGKVVKPSSSHRFAAALPISTCTGLWCVDPVATQTPIAGNDNNPVHEADGSPAPSRPEVPDSEAPGHVRPEPTIPEPGVAPDDPACGITLCCVAD